jgi:hypothetical protein
MVFTIILRKLGWSASGLVFGKRKTKLHSKAQNENPRADYSLRWSKYAPKFLQKSHQSLSLDLFISSISFFCLKIAVILVLLFCLELPFFQLYFEKTALPTCEWIDLEDEESSEESQQEVDELVSSPSFFQLPEVPQAFGAALWQRFRVAQSSLHQPVLAVQNPPPED